VKLLCHKLHVHNILAYVTEGNLYGELGTHCLGINAVSYFVLLCSAMFAADIESPSDCLGVITLVHAARGAGLSNFNGR